MDRFGKQKGYLDLCESWVRDLIESINSTADNFWLYELRAGKIGGFSWVPQLRSVSSENFFQKKSLVEG